MTFIAGGEELQPYVNAIIGLDDAFLCIKEFLVTYERQTCSKLQELQFLSYEKINDIKISKFQLHNAFIGI